MSRNIGDSAPRDSGWVIRAIMEMRGQIRELLSGRRLLNAATIDSGGIQIVNDGALTVVDTDGHVVGIIGALPAQYDRTDGSSQPGLAFYREDGSLAVLLGDFNPTVAPYKAAYQVLDRAGGIVMSDDTNGGKGLATPYLMMGAWTDNAAIGISAGPTTSATYVAQQVCFAFTQHPRVRVDMIVSSTSVGTTGLVGFFDPSGVQIGADVAVPANAASFASIGPVAMPSNWAHLSGGYFSLQAKRTAGTGAIGVRGTGFWGIQSA